MGLIVNELATNAFKYAFPEDRGGTVKISLSRQPSGLELVVEDDGVGCPPEPSQGMGSRLVRLLAVNCRAKSGAIVSMVDAEQSLLFQSGLIEQLQPQRPLMGWTGCFPRGDSLQRLPRSIRRSSP
ncbi:ATP-binding protein [Bradyrhizobium sp. 62B]|uniref:ATP-binding protein n=1 Tax=Bradyrhizobium sp. 62B TaxID=2898442 RepID=UPI0035E0D760